MSTLNIKELSEVELGEDKLQFCAQLHDMHRLFFEYFAPRPFRQPEL